MQQYAIAQAKRLLEKLRAQMERAAEKGDADSIHDLRVAIRRFTQCLRIFGQFFSRDRSRKTRKRLKHIMDLAAEVRDRDVALELMTAAETGKRNPNGLASLRAGLRRDRTRAWQGLLAEIRRVRQKRLEI